MSVRNFSTEVKYIEEPFQTPLTFKIGLSMNMMDIIDENNTTHAFNLMVDAAHPRDYKEQLNIGGEYTFMDMFSLRAGYMFPADERGLTAGAGVKKDLEDFTIDVNYAYVPFGVFGNLHNFSIRLAY